MQPIVGRSLIPTIDYTDVARSLGTRSARGAASCKCCVKRCKSLQNCLFFARRVKFAIADCAKSSPNWRYDPRKEKKIQSRSTKSSTFELDKSVSRNSRAFALGFCKLCKPRMRSSLGSARRTNQKKTHNKQDPEGLLKHSSDSLSWVELFKLS